MTVELAANVPVASVVWEGVEASGTSFTTTLGGGNHRIRATATLAGDGVIKLADGNYPITANCYALRNGVTDFFGNPRATPGKKVSIGYCQAPNPGLMLQVK